MKTTQLARSCPPCAAESPPPLACLPSPCRAHTSQLASQPARRSRCLPALSALRASQTLQLKSSYPARRRRPLLEKDTEVIPQMMLSWE